MEFEKVLSQPNKEERNPGDIGKFYSVFSNKGSLQGVL